MTRPNLDKDDSKEGIPIPPSKPKIWSLADTAVCKTPPPPNPGGANNPWASMGQFGGLDANLVRPNPAMAAAALRTNMFGMGRSPDMSYGGLSSLSHTKVEIPTHSPSVSALSGSSELPTDTPPQTPPNGVKLGGGGNGGLGLNNVMNSMNSSPIFQNSYGGPGGPGGHQSQYPTAAGGTPSSLPGMLQGPSMVTGQSLSPSGGVGGDSKMVLSQQFSINNHSTSNIHNGAFSRI